MQHSWYGQELLDVVLVYSAWILLLFLFQAKVIKNY